MPDAKTPGQPDENGNIWDSAGNLIGNVYGKLAGQNPNTTFGAESHWNYSPSSYSPGIDQSLNSALMGYGNSQALQGQQQGLANDLRLQSQGQGVNLAAQQFKAANQANNLGAASSIASLRGGMNPALAQRQLLSQQAMNNQSTALGSATLAQQLQLAAQQQYAQQLAAMRQGGTAQEAADSNLFGHAGQLDLGVNQLQQQNAAQNAALYLKAQEDAANVAGGNATREQQLILGGVNGLAAVAGSGVGTNGKAPTAPGTPPAQTGYPDGQAMGPPTSAMNPPADTSSSSSPNTGNGDREEKWRGGMIGRYADGGQVASSAGNNFDFARYLQQQADQQQAQSAAQQQMGQQQQGDQATAPLATNSGLGSIGGGVTPAAAGSSTFDTVVNTIAKLGPVAITAVKAFASHGGPIPGHGTHPVPAMVSPGEAEIPRSVMQSPNAPARVASLIARHQAHIVPGTAKVAGDSRRNDTVSQTLQPGSAVIPRSIMNAKDAPAKASRFIANLMAHAKSKDAPKKDPKRLGNALASHR